MLQLSLLELLLPQNRPALVLLEVQRPLRKGYFFLFLWHFSIMRIEVVLQVSHCSFPSLHNSSSILRIYKALKSIDHGHAFIIVSNRVILSLIILYLQNGLPPFPIHMQKY